jgi:hypothetical protein
MAQLKLAYASNQGTDVEIATIATSASLIDFNVGVWTGRIRDKKTTEEVTRDKQAGSSKAATVVKHLMTDDKDLDKIRAYAQECRMYVAKNTWRWTDGGTRLLPSKVIFEVTNELEGRSIEFFKLVDIFVNAFPLKVSAAAFKLGQLFDRNEFPDAQDVRKKFHFGYNITPVPTSGDFRVDVQKDVGDFLKKKFEADAEKKINAMLREPWERVYEHLSLVKERMDAALAYEATSAEDGRRAPKLFQSLIDNALDLVNSLDRMNVTGDAQLAECAAKMRRMFSSMDIKTVRESKDVQESVSKQVADLMAEFNIQPLEE